MLLSEPTTAAVLSRTERPALGGDAARQSAAEGVLGPVRAQARGDGVAEHQQVHRLAVLLLVVAVGVRRPLPQRLADRTPGLRRLSVQQLARAVRRPSRHAAEDGQRDAGPGQVSAPHAPCEPDPPERLRNPGHPATQRHPTHGSMYSGQPGRTGPRWRHDRHLVTGTRPRNPTGRAAAARLAAPRARRLDVGGPHRRGAGRTYLGALPLRAPRPRQRRPGPALPRRRLRRRRADLAGRGQPRPALAPDTLRGSGGALAGLPRGR